MKLPNYLLLFIGLLTIETACKDSEHTKDQNVDKNFTYVQDTSNQYIYDFMRIVVQDQKLDYGNGLDLIPQSNISNNSSDESLLTNYIIKNEELEAEITNDSNFKKDSTFSANDSIQTDSSIKLKVKDFRLDFFHDDFFAPPVYLSKQDIKYILSEKARLKDFKWDNLRLGFNLSNKSHWYVFSIPYFSKDRKTVFIMIRDLCKPFLCGSGKTVVYKYENGKWDSTTIQSWIH